MFGNDLQRTTPPQAMGIKTQTHKQGTSQVAGIKSKRD